MAKRRSDEASADMGSVKQREAHEILSDFDEFGFHWKSVVFGYLKVDQKVEHPNLHAFILPVACEPVGRV